MTNKKYWIIGGIGILILVALLFSFYNNSNITGEVIENPNEKVRIAYLPVTQGLPIYMALEEGWFEEEGIDVELIKFESPNQIIDALLQNRVDFATAAANGIVGIVDQKNPGKIKIIAIAGGDLNVPSQNIVVPIDSDLKTIEDLKGKRLGILGGTIQWTTITRGLLEKHGLDMDKDITIVEIAPALQVPALASGQIDALLALEPISTIAISNGAGKLMIAGPVEQNIANPFYGGADVVRTKFAEENPEITKKVVGIIERGILEIEQNPEESKKYLKGYTPLDEEIISKTPILRFRTYNQLSEEDIQGVQDFYDIFTKYGVVENKIDFEKILYSESN